MKVVGFEIEGWEQNPFEKLKDEHEVVMSESAVTDDLESRFRNAGIISTFIYYESGSQTAMKWKCWPSMLSKMTMRPNGSDFNIRTWTTCWQRPIS
jgi:hypothetical protein